MYLIRQLQQTQKRDAVLPTRTRAHLADAERSLRPVMPLFSVSVFPRLLVSRLILGLVFLAVFAGGFIGAGQPASASASDMDCDYVNPCDHPPSHDVCIEGTCLPACVAAAPVDSADVEPLIGESNSAPSFTRALLWAFDPSPPPQAR